MLEFPNYLSMVMFLTGCALLTAILLRRSYRYFGKRTIVQRGEPALQCQPRPVGPWSGMQHDTAAHIERQKVELHDMARDATGKLNSKILLLQELIDQSDRQIEKMESLLRELETAPK